MVGITVYHGLCPAGHEVTVLVNQPREKGPVSDGVKSGSVELDDSPKLEDTLQGYDALVCVLPVFYPQERRRFLSVAVSAGIKRFVTIERGLASKDDLAHILSYELGQSFVAWNPISRSHGGKPT